MASYRYIVSGRVQGVGFRYFVRRQAERLGVSGFTRNLVDGSVEVVAEGDDDRLSALEESLRRGPDFAHVAHLERAAITPRGDQGFQIR